MNTLLAVLFLAASLAVFYILELTGQTHDEPGLIGWGAVGLIGLSIIFSIRGLLSVNTSLDKS